MEWYGYIYIITNTVNNKVYIGQTTIGFDKRYKGSIKNTHNEHLKRAIEKYGKVVMMKQELRLRVNIQLLEKNFIGSIYRYLT